jgi:hypothetical protein
MASTSQLSARAPVQLGRSATARPARRTASARTVRSVRVCAAKVRAACPTDPKRYNRTTAVGGAFGRRQVTQSPLGRPVTAWSEHDGYVRGASAHVQPSFSRTFSPAIHGVWCGSPARRPCACGHETRRLFPSVSPAVDLSGTLQRSSRDARPESERRQAQAAVRGGGTTASNHRYIPAPARKPFSAPRLAASPKGQPLVPAQQLREGQRR